MSVLIIGDTERAAEINKRLAHGTDIDIVSPAKTSLPGKLDDYHLIFDLDADNEAPHANDYLRIDGIWVFASAVKKQLVQIVSDSGDLDIKCKLAGINAWPGFLEMDTVELSLHNAEDKPELENLMSSLNWSYDLCSDRVGMVTPRVISMIINEACYTLQEGTANMTDIDAAMKMGTNYPYGPFEWADKIGVDNIYKTLLAIYEDTKDERYKICPLLKTIYLRREGFYNNKV